MSKLPVVSGKELVNALEKAGFVVVRQKEHIGFTLRPFYFIV
jgi:predicted RNA binding protein YcfA (HicA-like mRNA interferase family)